MLKKTIITALGVVAINEVASFVNPELFPELEEGKTVHIIDLYSPEQESIGVYGSIKFTRDEEDYLFDVKDPNKKNPSSKKIKNNSDHKGALIGKMLEDILLENDVVEFRIYKELDSYNFSQPDFLFIAIMIYFGYATWEEIVKKYLINNDTESWFNAVYGIWGPFPNTENLNTPPIQLISPIIKIFLVEENSQYISESVNLYG